MLHHEWFRLMKTAGGQMEFEVVNRPIIWLDKTFEPGDLWPIVNVNDRAAAHLAKNLYEQRRISPNPAWLVKNVPGSERWLTAEELARVKAAEAPPKQQPLAPSFKRK